MSASDHPANGAGLPVGCACDHNTTTGDRRERTDRESPAACRRPSPSATCCAGRAHCDSPRSGGVSEGVPAIAIDDAGGAERFGSAGDPTGIERNVRFDPGVRAGVCAEGLTGSNTPLSFHRKVATGIGTPLSFQRNKVTSWTGISRHLRLVCVVAWQGAKDVGATQSPDFGDTPVFPVLHALRAAGPRVYSKLAGDFARAAKLIDQGGVGMQGYVHVASKHQDDYKSQLHVDRR